MCVWLFPDAVISWWVWVFDIFETFFHHLLSFCLVVQCDLLHACFGSIDYGLSDSTAGNFIIIVLSSAVFLNQPGVSRIDFVWVSVCVCGEVLGAITPGTFLLQYNMSHQTVTWLTLWTNPFVLQESIRSWFYLRELFVLEVFFFFFTFSCFFPAFLVCGSLLKKENWFDLLCLSSS